MHLRVQLRLPHNKGRTNVSLRFSETQGAATSGLLPPWSSYLPLPLSVQVLTSGN